MYWPAVLCGEPVPIRDIIQNDHKNRVKKDGVEYRGGRDAERTQPLRYFFMPSAPGRCILRTVLLKDLRDLMVYVKGMISLLHRLHRLSSSAPSPEASEARQAACQRTPCKAAPVLRICPSRRHSTGYRCL